LLSSDKELESDTEADNEEIGVYSGILKGSTGVDGMAYMETNERNDLGKNKRRRK